MIKQKVVQNFKAFEFGIHNSVKLQRSNNSILCSNPPRYQFHDKDRKRITLTRDTLLDVTEVQSFEDNQT